MIKFSLSKKDLELKKSCPTCGSLKIKKVSSAYVYNINYFETSYCQNCDLVFRSIRPKKSWFEKSWNKRDKTQKKNKIEPYDKKIEEFRIFTYDGVAKFLKRFCPTKKTKIKCIDVGCGTGTGLHKFEEQDFEVVGIEPDPSRSKVGKELYGAVIYEDTVEKFKTDEKFDVLTFIHSLEHIHDPLNTLKKMTSLVKMDGLIYIEVPDMKHHVKDWNDIIYLGHLSNFSLKNLLILGEKCHLEPVSRFKMRHGPHLGILFKKKKIIKKNKKKIKESPLTFKMIVNLYSKNLKIKNKYETPIKVSIPFINDLSLSYVTNQNSIIATKMVNHDKKLSQSIRVISWNPKSKIFEINPKQTNQNSNIKNPPLSLKRRSSYECF